MKNLKLNNNGEFEIDEDGNLVFVENIEEVKQRLKIKMLTNLNEWFLDLNLGIDWHEILSNLDNKKERIKLEIVRALSEDDAVNEIKNIIIDFDSEERYLTIGYEATVLEGETIEQEVEVI